MLVDTDIVIDYLRGVAEAVDFVERHIDQIAVSAITVGELYSGVRDGDERVALDDFVSAINVLVVDQEIGKTAGIYRGKYRKSHQLGLADCLIAATASGNRLPLKTLNLKHFPMLADADVPYLKK